MSGFSTGFCQKCGVEAGSTDLFRCSRCREVYYCSKDHQRADWNKHKMCCMAVHENPTSIFLEVKEGVGNGLTNQMKSHIFSTKQDGLDFASKYFQESMNCGFRSPFSELLGWKVEIYCSAITNQIFPPGNGFERLVGNRVKGINGAGVYLGCELHSGITQLNNLDGPIFVTGRNSAGQPLTQPCLWGILNFIWDCMDLFGEEEAPHLTFREWAREYKERSWEPSGGYGGIDIYNTTVSEQGRNIINHRSAAEGV